MPFIVRVQTNFSELLRIAYLDSLSTVTRFTEGLLKNNFDDLLGAGDPFHDLARR